MSLLLDENLSHRMLPAIREHFPTATHVREHGLISASDDEIWNFARDRELVIVTRDFDFIERGAESQAPKYMEWYGAFGLMVTLVWLYIEILRLLAKLNRRN